MTYYPHAEEALEAAIKILKITAMNALVLGIRRHQSEEFLEQFVLVQELRFKVMLNTGKWPRPVPESLA